MKTLIIVLLLISQQSYAIELSHKDATSFLKSQGCEFGAFKVYKGNVVSPVLKKGDLNSRGICISSYETKGAKKIYSCIARTIDFNNGRYYGDINFGSSRRIDGKVCSLETMKKIYQKGSYPQLEAMVDSKWEWVVGVDNHKFTEFFLKNTKSK